MLKEDYKYLLYGLRKRLGSTHERLASLLGFSRRMLGKYEEGARFPGKERREIILNFAKKHYNSMSLISYGKRYYFEVEKRERSCALELEYSEKLAEVIGIILGDGCVQKDGCIVIAFHQKNDWDFIQRCVKPLFYELLKCNMSTAFKGNSGSLLFYSKPFVKFLDERCNIKHGNKIKNCTTIPRWCFLDKKYLIAVLRGLFDTDGNFSISKNSPIVRWKFSIKCNTLIKDVCHILDILNFENSFKISKKGIDICIYSRKRAINFFKVVGSNNIKHISRFLIWRVTQKEVKIMKSGMNGLIREIKEIYMLDIRKLKLPFVWQNNFYFQRLIEEDEEYLRHIEIRESYHWDSLVSELLGHVHAENLAKTLNINPKSIKRWQKGLRTPAIEITHKILPVMKQHNINLEDYKK